MTVATDEIPEWAWQAVEQAVWDDWGIHMDRTDAVAETFARHFSVHGELLEALTGVLRAHHSRNHFNVSHALENARAVIGKACPAQWDRNGEADETASAGSVERSEIEPGPAQAGCAQTPSQPTDLP